MSTGPGPTRKADGSTEASVDDIADLLVEDESHQGHTEGDQALDDGLDVMLETPGPALVSTFMPPPPSPVAADVADESAEDPEDSESAEEPGEATNLAYEDLLAKLVLPAKAPEPEPAMPALAAPLPLPEFLADSATPTPAAMPFNRPSSANFQVAPLADDRTLVTVNPLVAEEQEAAFREGRSAAREQAPLVIQQDMHPAVTEPMVPANGGAKSRLLYLMLGGLLVLGGMILAVLVLKLLMPTPAPPPAMVITPTPPPPSPAPPAHVEPLPPSAPPAAAAPTAAPVPAPSPEATTPAAGEGLAPAIDKTQLKAHRTTTHKVAHVAAPKPAPVANPAPAPKAPKAAAAPTVAPAAKAPKASSGKKPKTSGYADPFDN